MMRTMRLERARASACAIHLALLFMAAGTARAQIETAASGNWRVLAFCDVCGSALYACAADNPQTYSLRLGTITQRHELGTPQRQIWTRRRLAWVTLPQDIDTFGGQP